MANETDYEELEDNLSEEETDELEDRGDNVEDNKEDEDGEEGRNEEEDDDGESEEDEEDDETDTGDDEVEEQKKKNIKIPKYRLDQEIEKNRALREREKWLEEQLTKLINSSQNTKDSVETKVQEVEFDFDAAEEAYITAIIEGDSAEAKKIRKQIDSEKKKNIEAEVEAKNKDNLYKLELKREDEKFQASIENFESKYSFFNPNKKAYNEDAVDTVNTLMAGFIAKGLSKTEALEKAVNKVVPMFHKEPVKEQQDAKKRLVDQRKKNVQTMNKTPPKVSGRKSSVEISDIDIDGMDEKEFAKMSKDKKTLAKLRGDIL